MSDLVWPPKDCFQVELPMGIASGRSLAGDDSRMRIEMFKRKTDGHLIGRVWFGEGTQGPPNHVHGGASAYVLDEAMGAVGWMNDYPVVAKKISFELFKMAPLKTNLEIKAWVVEATERAIQVEAELRLPGGEVSVKSTGDFAILTREKIAELNVGSQDPKNLLNNPAFKWSRRAR